MAEHPITPPPELRRLWAQQAQRMYPRDSIARQEHIANQAARWSADPDLWAYVKWTEDCGHRPSVSTAHWSNSMAEHPITPPHERLKQWEDDILNERDNVDHVLDCAWKDGFLAGADQELEACCADIYTVYGKGQADWLRSMRRPKSPSLKEKALAVIENSLICDHLSPQDEAIIRRALEALDD